MASSKTQVNTTWATPNTWATGDPLTASNMNAQLRDELNALKTPAHAHGKVDEAADYTINSTSWTDVDATNLAMSINTAGGKVLVFFVVTTFTSSGSGGTTTCFDIDMDGTQVAGDDGIVQTYTSSGGTPATECVTVMAIIDSATVANHIFKLKWKRYTSSTSVAGLYAGAGTSQHDVHPHMGAIEL